MIAVAEVIVTKDDGHSYTGTFTGKLLVEFNEVLTLDNNFVRVYRDMEYVKACSNNAYRRKMAYYWRCSCGKRQASHGLHGKTLEGARRHAETKKHSLSPRAK